MKKRFIPDPNQGTEKASAISFDMLQQILDVHTILKLQDKTDIQEVNARLFIARKYHRENILKEKEF